MSQAANPGAPPPTGTFLGHPRGLFVLFFTEMWERFSYYGMRSLLVLYMVNHLFIRPDVGQRLLGFNVVRHALETVYGPLAVQPLSSQIYGLYTAFVYLTPFFGGMQADKVLGQRRSVILGGVLMAIGQFTLMSEHLFFPGLILLILGNGAFKPNISTQVGSLYPEGDPRRDGAFTIFYMGINLGAFFSPLVCGTLGQSIGWKWGFGSAGVGMVLGLILYIVGQPVLGKAPSPLRTSAPKATLTVVYYLLGVAGGLCVLMLAPPLLLALLPTFARWALLAIVAVAVLTLFIRWMGSLDHDERWSIWAIIILCALNIVFWGCYEQQGNTMQLWADRNTNWHFFGWNVPSTWFQAFNPFMIFVFAPLLNIFWAWQNKRKQEPTSVTKMAIGCFLLGMSYIIMIIAAWGMAPDAKRSVMWLAGTTLVITMGELYLSPIGLSFVTKVAPARMVSMMMGVWFLSSFFGNYLNGFLGMFWERMPHQAFFLMLTLLGVGTGVLMMLVNRPLRRIVAKHEAVTAQAS